ncbi:hypothetical protein [Streptomyces formicae]
MGVPPHDLTSDRQDTYTLFTPGNAHSAKICRDFVQRTLETLGLGHLGDAAALCTSELVTNCPRPAGPMRTRRVGAGSSS